MESERPGEGMALIVGFSGWHMFGQTAWSCTLHSILVYNQTQLHNGLEAWYALKTVATLLMQSQQVFMHLQHCVGE